MTSVGSYYLLGPIKVNDTFILTYNSENIAYFLTLVKGENGSPDDFIFDPRAAGDSNTISDPLVMRVISTGSNKYGITYEDSASQLRYMTGIKVKDKFHAGSTTKSTSLVFHQTAAAPWPTIPFLTGVCYSINTVSNQPIIFGSYSATSGSNGIATSIKMDKGKPVINGLNSGFRAVPTTWLVRGTCDSNQSLKCVVDNEVLWAAGETGQFKDGFTDSTDCNAGVRYTYCPPGKDCSVSCKGPCPDSNVSSVGCFFDSSIKGFKCEENPVDVPWYKQPGFIIGATLAGLVIIILIIFLIFRFSER